MDATDTLLEPGFRLGSYELLGVIARGGMATVWLARLRMKGGLHTLVSVKTILPELRMDPQFQRMFQDEARIACSIDHPNVARLLDVGEEQGRSYIVMEYVAGESLARLHRTLARSDRLLPLGAALRVAADLSSGLHAAHELRDAAGQLLHVVHRDVSPQNVLVSDSGFVKLIDFGVAKARGRLALDTTAGTAKGKARYMAPEQAVGTGVDRRADIWAVGAVLYELLCGRTPIDGPDDMHVFRALLGPDRVPPLPREVPEPVRDIVHRALSRAPADRFPSGAALRDAIEDAMHGLGLRSSPAELEGVMAAELPDRIAERRAFVQRALLEADVREARTSEHARQLASEAPGSVRGESRATEQSRSSPRSSPPLDLPSGRRPGSRGRVVVLAASLAGIVGTGVWLRSFAAPRDMAQAPVTASADRGLPALPVPEPTTASTPDPPSSGAPSAPLAAPAAASLLAPSTRRSTIAPKPSAGRSPPRWGSIE